jgi:ABC-type Fe3+-hydroxamate transport system substrate-binding protein
MSADFQSQSAPDQPPAASPSAFHQLGPVRSVLLVLVAVGLIVLWFTNFSLHPGAGSGGSGGPTPTGVPQPAQTPQPPPALPAELAPARVVVLSPGLAQTLRTLNLAHLVVGRHAFDEWSDPALPVCGDQTGIDFEKLLLVSPTHVLIQWGKRDLPERLVSLANKQGWILRDYPLLTLDDVSDASSDVLTMLAIPERARQQKLQQAQIVEGRVEMPDEAALRLAAAALKNIAPIPAQTRFNSSILLLHSTTPPAALGPGSFHHDLLIKLGLTPAIAEGSAYMPLDREDVLRRAPEAIILIQPSRVGEERAPRNASIGDGAPRIITGEEAIARLGGLKDLNIPAIKNRRVALIDEPTALLPGLGLVRVAQALRLAGEAFAATNADEPAIIPARTP